MFGCFGRFLQLVIIRIYHSLLYKKNRLHLDIYFKKNGMKHRLHKEEPVMVENQESPRKSRENPIPFSQTHFVVSFYEIIHDFV